MSQPVPRPTPRRALSRRLRRRLIFGGACLGLLGAAAVTLEVARKDCCPEVDDVPLSAVRAHPIHEDVFLSGGNEPYLSFPEEARPLGIGECELGWALLRELVADDPTRSVVISPHAIALALSALATGSQGETRGEILRALKFEESTQELRYTMWRVEEWLRAGAVLENSNKTFTRRSIPEYASGVGLWPPPGMGVRPKYPELVAQAFRATVHARAAEGPEDLAPAMTGWARKRSGGHLDLILPNASDVENGIVVAAVSDVAGWWAPPSIHLDSQGEKSDPEAENDTFSSHRNLVRFENRDFVVVSAPAGVYLLRVLLLLPKKDGRGMASPAPCTTASRPWSAWQVVTARVPAFSITSNLELRNVLSKVGVSRVFDPWRARLTCLGPGGLSELERLVGHGDHVASFRHAARYKQDDQGLNHPTIDSRQGTYYPRGPAGDPVDFDRPFAVLVQEANTGIVLYAAWVADAGGEKDK